MCKSELNRLKRNPRITREINNKKKKKQEKQREENLNSSVFLTWWALDKILT